MSLEEYFKSDTYKAIDKLRKILSESVIDWDRFDRALDGLPDKNTTCEGDTILSELYHYCPDGIVLVEITKRFLAKGFNVRANGGLNGSQCLHNLCWATYDRYILDAAKLLLDAGARSDLPLDMEGNDAEDIGVKSSISWRLGDWVTGEYAVANIFEAYWAIIEAFEAGRNYHSICGFEDCIGEPFVRADFIPMREGTSVYSRDLLTFFDGQLVLWFGSKPLVVSKYIDFVVNPLVAEENRNTLISINGFFEPLLNAKLLEFRFIDQCTAQLLFDNGMCLLFSSTDYRDKDNRRGFFEIRHYAETVSIQNRQIHRVMLTPGVVYSDTCRNYQEHSVALLCDDEAFLVCTFPVGYCESHQIRIVECSPQFVSEYKRSVALPTMTLEKVFFHNRKPAGIRLHCGVRYFYIFVDQFRDLQMKLGFEKNTEYEELLHGWESQKLNFRYDPPAAFFNGNETGVR